jgi:hypothetical protein
MRQQDSPSRRENVENESSRVRSRTSQPLRSSAPTAAALELAQRLEQRARGALGMPLKVAVPPPRPSPTRTLIDGGARQASESSVSQAPLLTVAHAIG